MELVRGPGCRCLGPLQTGARGWGGWGGRPALVPIARRWEGALSALAGSCPHLAVPARLGRSLGSVCELRGLFSVALGTGGRELQGRRATSWSLRKGARSHSPPGAAPWCAPSPASSAPRVTPAGQAACRGSPRSPRPVPAGTWSPGWRRGRRARHWPGLTGVANAAVPGVHHRPRARGLHHGLGGHPEPRGLPRVGWAGPTMWWPRLRVAGTVGGFGDRLSRPWLPKPRLSVGRLCVPVCPRRCPQGRLREAAGGGALSPRRRAGQVRLRCAGGGRGAARGHIWRFGPVRAPPAARGPRPP